MNRRFSSKEDFASTSINNISRCKTKSSVQTTQTSSFNNKNTTKIKNEHPYLTPFSSSLISNSINITDRIDKEVNSIIFKTKTLNNQNKIHKPNGISSNDIEYSIQKLSKKINISEKQINIYNKCQTECKNETNAFSQKHQSAKKIGNHFINAVTQIQKEIEEVRLIINNEL